MQKSYREITKDNAPTAYGGARGYVGKSYGAPRAYGGGHCPSCTCGQKPGGLEERMYR